MDIVREIRALIRKVYKLERRQMDTINGVVNVGDSTGNVKIDGVNKRIIISDGSNNRVLIGKGDGLF